MLTKLMPRGDRKIRIFEMYWLVTVLFLFNLAHFTQSFTTEAESNLFDDLFKNTSAVYNPLVRPSSTVTVSVEFHLLTINELNTKSQTLSVNGFFSLLWNDPRLTWTPASFAGITKVFQTESNIWRPEVIIDNSVADLEPLHSPDDQVKLRIQNNGEVKWETSGIYNVHCDIDITYYPLDSQKCYLEMTSWAYAVSEVTLINTAQIINIEDFRENGEWRVLKTETTKSQLSDDGELRDQLMFMLHLERRSAFYILNVLLPVLITGVLVPVVFLLPLESGEKISYVLTLLLAIAVVLTIVADQLPTTSKHVSVFAIYLAVNLGLAAFSILVSVAALYTHHQHPTREIPKIWRKVTLNVFMRFPRHWKIEKYKKLQTGKVTPMETKNNTEDIQMEKVDIQAGEIPADLDITWTDISESLDAFSFRAFLIAFVVLFVVFMMALGIGASVSAN